MSGDLRRRELGAFLRASRERLDPADFGIAVRGRRRTPGLRREEIASESGVGLAWYAWLEQGRVQTSREVLEALARTMRMTHEERRHLLALGGYAADGVADDGLVARLRPLLDNWPLTPALLLDQRFDVLAGNAAHAAVWPEPALTGRPNLLLSLAGSARLESLLVPEEQFLYELFLRFRARADRFPAEDVVAGLRELRPELAHWWSCRAVREFGSWPVTVLADDARLRFECSLLRPDDTATLLVQAPVDAETREWLRQRC
ncbi:Helix-turn-helix domain-containing protein [Saccharopolyspora antimicrobica]|uniref:Helix-turn-helix domain-containing protein n=1 Tax=Saccharopolyspora antimicrobica TaxID=455193 RepID=A0A1I5JG08_9PSEU|nr:helix-turn-helix domain-containing protein [Saccharopolyspora antimicrobica]RKT82525.1 helix-turn-helix protein [Saccharopolyspora antimicrobica]SFO71735.1 Helix-turn-helix domain-containing protein [Saccharopolyspora antimicrobica]